MSFNLTILGSSSAVPTRERNQSAQVLILEDKTYLIDAGEGVQKSMIIHSIKPSKIQAVFISHLHPDHYIGLIGLLCSLGLRGKTDKLEIIGPKGIKEVLQVQLELSSVLLNYELCFTILKGDNGTQVYEDNRISVSLLNLNHRLQCFGFVFHEKPGLRTLNIDKARTHNIPVEAYGSLKKGLDFKMPNGKVIAALDYTFPAPAPRSYAYCTDTRPVAEIVPFIKGCGLLYHDSTFMADLQAKAIATHHSTSVESAKLAMQASVQQLILGHFSSRYGDLLPMLKEAQEIFPNTDLATEGRIFSIDHQSKN